MYIYWYDGTARSLGIKNIYKISLNQMKIELTGAFELTEVSGTNIYLFCKYQNKENEKKTLLDYLIY